MAHKFKGRAATHKGKPVTIIRGANKGDVPRDFDLSEPHFLVEAEGGDKKVVPVAEVKAAKTQEVVAPLVEDKDSF